MNLDPELQKRWSQACRSCQARILWCVTLSGKAIPVDPEPVYGGNLQLEAGPDGITARYVEPAGDVERWVSHFSSCKFASEHRKAKEPAGSTPSAERAPGEVVLGFGKHRGQRLDKVPRGYLIWLRDKLQESLENPDKQHLRASNAGLIAAIGAVLNEKRRDAPAHVDPMTPPPGEPE